MLLRVEVFPHDVVPIAATAPCARSLPYAVCPAPPLPVVSPLPPVYATLSTAASAGASAALLSVGRKGCDICFPDDKSVSREHAMLRVVSAAVPTVPGTMAPRNEAERLACQQNKDLLCLVLENVGKLGCLVIQERPGNEDGEDKNENDNKKKSHQDNDSETDDDVTDDDDNNEQQQQSSLQKSQSQSQTSGSGSGAVSAALLTPVTRQLVQQAFSKHLEITLLSTAKDNNVICLPNLLAAPAPIANDNTNNNNSDKQQQQSQDNRHLRVIVQLGKLGSTLILTRESIRAAVTGGTNNNHAASAAPGASSLLHLLDSTPLWAVGIEAWQTGQDFVLTRANTTVLLQEDGGNNGLLTPSPKVLSAWAHGIPIVRGTLFVQALLDRTRSSSSVEAPMPNLAECAAEATAGLEFLKQHADSTLWKDFTLLVSSRSSDSNTATATTTLELQLQQMVRAAGATIVQVTDTDTEETIAEKVPKFSKHCFVLNVTNGNATQNKESWRLRYPALTPKQLAKCLVQQIPLPVVSATATAASSAQSDVRQSTRAATTAVAASQSQPTTRQMTLQDSFSRASAAASSSSSSSQRQSQSQTQSQKSATMTTKRTSESFVDLASSSSDDDDEGPSSRKRKTAASATTSSKPSAPPQQQQEQEQEKAQPKSSQSQTQQQSSASASQATKRQWMDIDSNSDSSDDDDDDNKESNKKAKKSEALPPTVTSSQRPQASVAAVQEKSLTESIRSGSSSIVQPDAMHTSNSSSGIGTSSVSQTKESQGSASQSLSRTVTSTTQNKSQQQQPPQDQTQQRQQARLSPVQEDDKSDHDENPKATTTTITKSRNTDVASEKVSSSQQQQQQQAQEQQKRPQPSSSSQDVVLPKQSAKQTVPAQPTSSTTTVAARTTSWTINDKKTNKAEETNASKIKNKPERVESTTKGDDDKAERTGKRQTLPKAPDRKGWFVTAPSDSKQRKAFRRTKTEIMELAGYEKVSDAAPTEYFCVSLSVNKTSKTRQNVTAVAYATTVFPNEGNKTVPDFKAFRKNFVVGFSNPHANAAASQRGTTTAMEQQQQQPASQQPPRPRIEFRAVLPRESMEMTRDLEEQRQAVEEQQRKADELFREPTAGAGARGRKRRA